MSAKARKKNNGKDKPRTRFHYIKGQQFRTIRADGAIGGVTPTGLIHFSLYSERFAIPREVTHEVNDDGSLGAQIPEDTVSREGIVRELDVDVFLAAGTAEILSKWLRDRVKEVKAREKMLQRQAEGKSNNA